MISSNYSQTVKTLFICTLAIFLSSISLSADPSISEDTRRIIEIRDNEIEKINEQYRAALERLKSRYMQEES